MILAKFSIKRQVTLTMFYLIAISFGLFSLTQLKIDFFPNITFPIIGIITTYNGVGPEDIENLVTRPLEESVSAVKNVEKVTSQSYKGNSIITLEFEYGTDMDQAEIDVRNNIDMMRDYLPDDASSPIVFAFDPSLQPIQFITVSSPYLGPAELRQLSEDKIEPLLERVEGVASVETSGGLERQVNVYMNPVLLASYKLSPDDVAMAIQTGSGLLPAGTINTETKSYNLRVFSEYRNVDQIANTVVRQNGIGTDGNAQPVRVKDVARVEDSFKERGTEVRSDYSGGVLIVVSKQSDANTVQASVGVQEALPEIEKLLPQGTKFSIMYDQSEFIINSINNLRDSALISFVLAFLVIYFFLRNLRGSIIMGVSIPVSIVTTFAVLYASDLTLNIISMAGLALAVGMLVDNSIVVLENIYRHREMGKDKDAASDEGTTEVGMAITASTLTTVAVFVPVLFVPNITGQLFKDMVLTIVFSLMVSLLVALTLVPMMASRILSMEEKKKNTLNQRMKDKMGSWIENMTSNYRRWLHWSIYHRKAVLGLTGLAFVLSIVVATMLGGEFMPKTDQGMIQLVVEAPPGSPIEKLRKNVYDLEKIFKEEVDSSELVSLAIMFGDREGWGAFGTTSSTIEIYARLTPREKRSRSQFEIQDNIRKKLDKMAGMSSKFMDNASFSTERDVEVKFIGFDVQKAKAIAEQFKTEMQKTKGLVDVSLNVQETSPEIQVRLNKDLLNKYGLSYLQIANNISTAIQGKVSAQFREAGEEYDVYVQLDEKYRNKRDAIERLQIALPAGSMIPLKSIASITEEESAPTIFRENQSRFVSVGAGLSGIQLTDAVKKINEIIAKTPIPGDLQVIVGGAAEDQQEAVFYMMLAFIAAVLLVYMIMAAQFESLIDPLIIMFTVPLSLIGVFFFLFITGTTLSVMALVGIVMLVGIAVNNGIVLVDYINQLRDRGMELFEAVEVGSVARIRPVLMTALTTILGMVPLAIELGSGSETWSPLAKAVIGGLTATTVLTLVFIPVMYIVFERTGEKVKNYFKNRKKRKEVIAPAK
jgi:HAE1 family hydrophobic/amphiphilic exporter-1